MNIEEFRNDCKKCISMREDLSDEILDILSITSENILEDGSNEFTMVNMGYEQLESLMGYIP